MAYIGIDPNVGDITFQKFTGDGSTTAFTLAQNVASGEAILVTVGNVVQEPGSSASYTAYANTLTFSEAPANTDEIVVRFFGRAVDQPLSYAMQVYKYIATAGQTAFTGADNAGAILAFSGNDVDVYLNGIHLDTVDYTPSSGTTITLASGASLNDEIVIRAFRAFSVTDTVSKASGGTFSGAVTIDRGSSSGTPLQLTTTGSGHNIDMTDSDSTARIRNVNGYLRIGADHNNESGNSAIRFEVDGSEVARLDASGNFLVGKTAVNATDVGIVANANGRLYVTVDGSDSIFNRTSSDGNIISFRKDGTTVGSIASRDSNSIYIGSSLGGAIRFTSTDLRPVTFSDGSNNDNAIDVGDGAARFDDIFATNGNINTSDANEKQQIASLTSAEITAATAISKLFKTFKWNSAVEAKGDAARTHTGIIAQQVETAMTDAGLDAGDYAFFISSDWYVDADGNEVEADDEGAIAKNRKGIRYPELLSFVGAATEQRLADIETRLTALENI